MRARFESRSCRVPNQNRQARPVGASCRVPRASYLLRLLLGRQVGDGARQRARFETTRIYCNADMGPAEVRVHCELDDAGRMLIKAAVQQMGLSARAYHRVL